MIIKRALFLLPLLFWGASAAAFPYAIDPLVNGADMAGIEVTVTFDDGSSETAIWAATDAISGQATGSGWSLAESGDTLNQPGIGAAWTLSNFTAHNIVGFKVDAWVAKVFFDVIMEAADPSFPLGYDEHTPGSGQGRPFLGDGTIGIDTVSYLNPLSPPDLYGAFEVSFQGMGLLPDSSFRFMIDTDTIPEPPFQLLMALGLAGLLLRRRLAA